jgi:hypothetical protein
MEDKQKKKEEDKTETDKKEEAQLETDKPQKKVPSLLCARGCVRVM